MKGLRLEKHPFSESEENPVGKKSNTARAEEILSMVMRQIT